MTTCISAGVEFTTEIQNYFHCAFKHIRTYGPQEQKNIKHQPVIHPFSNKKKNLINHQRKFYVLTHNESDHLLV